MSNEFLVLAYIDPGTSGMVLGGLGMVLAWLGIALVVLRRWLVRSAVAARNFVRRHPLVVGGGALAVAGAAGLSYFAWGAGAPDGAGASMTQQPAQRVLAIGLDGADPRVLQELMDGGHLPNMERLAEGGAFLPLEVPNPPQSPVVWATLATGQSPGENGIFDFIARDPQTYLPRLSLLESARHAGRYEYPIRTQAFWDVTTAHGIPAVVLRWPSTFPPRQIHGRMLAGLGVPDLRGALGRYAFFTDAAEAKEGDEGGGEVIKVSFSGTQASSGLPGPRVRALTGVKTISTPLSVRVDPEARAAWVTLGGREVALREGEWSELVELTFESGLFAKYRGLTRLYLQSAAAPFGLLATSVEMHPDAPATPFAYPPDFPAELHRAIGLFHTLGMPEDTKAYGNGHMDEAGFLALCERVERERRAMLDHELARFDSGVLAVVFDTLDRIQHMTPLSGDLPGTPVGRYLIDFDKYLGTVLHRLPEGTAVMLFSDHGFSEFRQAVDLNRWLVEQGELALDEGAYRARPAGSSGELFKFVRWEGSRAYALGFSGLYVNVRGREAQGTVEPSERRAVAEALRAKLQALVDPRTGERVVHRVYLREELYQGSALEDAPDLVVGFRPGYRGSWQSAIGGVAEEVIAPNEKTWQRDHIVDASFVKGSLLTSFPVHVADPNAYDIAPTLLSLLGLQVPESMHGRALQLVTPVATRPAHAGGGTPP